MSLHVIEDVARAASGVRDAQHISRFKHAASEFVRVLSEVPDEAAGSVSSDNVRALQLLAQDVIDLIEERVPDVGNAGDAQELVSDVYEIRRLLEEVTRWRQHYALTTRSV